MGGTDALREARKAGGEYLLQRRLLRTLSTGELVGGWVTTFAYPFRWRSPAVGRRAALPLIGPPGGRFDGREELV